MALRLRKGEKYTTEQGIIYFFFQFVGDFAEKVRRACNALLNTNGGILVIGVEPQKEIIRGIRNVTRSEEDGLRLILDREIRHFKPCVSPSLYRFSVRQFHSPKDLCLIEVRVSAGPVGEMYMNGDEKVFIVRQRLISGPLYPHQIKELVIAKYKQEVLASANLITPAVQDKVDQRKVIKSK